MKLLKRITLFFVLVLTVFAVCIIFSSCAKGGEKAKIYLVTAENFEKTVELGDEREIKGVSLKELEKADEEYLTVGQKYYAVMYIDRLKVNGGRFVFSQNVTYGEDDLFAGRKRGDKIKTYVDYKTDYIKFSASNPKKTDHYFAVCFELDGYTENENGAGLLTLRFPVSTGLNFVKEAQEFTVEKEIRYKKQVTAASTIKYLTRAEYMSENIDENLKDSIEAPLGEKIYAVIDYTLTAFKDVEEGDTASVTVTAKSENTSILNLNVEDFPTAEYEISGNDVTAKFKLKDSGEAGTKYRFIVSFTPNEAGAVTLSAKMFSKEISFLSGGSITSTSTVNGELAVESKLEYALSQDGSYYIVTGFGSENGNVITVPATYQNLPVKEIADNVFSNVSFIKQLYLNEGLEKIGAGAFRSCTGIESVVIPKSVTQIGSGAFANLPDTTVICEAKTRPDGWSADFADGTSYLFWDYGKFFTLHNGDKEYIFYFSQKNAKYVNVPAYYNGLPITEVANFGSATDLVKLTLPETVITIRNIGLTKCVNLKEIYVSEKNNVLSSVDGALYYRWNGTTLVRFPSGKAVTSFTVPDNVDEISSYAFYGCTSLVSVTLPSSLKTIPDNAFENCTSLSSITLDGKVTSIGKDAFKNTSIYNDSSNWYGDVLYYDGWLLEAKQSVSGEYSVKDGVSVIADYAFYNCTGLSKINTADSVGYIGKYSFAGCTGLTSLTMRFVISIDIDAFSDCTNITEIFLPRTLDVIGAYAFWGCTKLESIRYEGYSSDWERITKGEAWDNANAETKLDYSLSYAQNPEE